MAGKIKEAFMGEKGLAGKVKTLPMAKVFELKNVKSVSWFLCESGVPSIPVRPGG